MGFNSGFKGLRMQCKPITIYIHKIIGDKYKKRVTNVPHRFPKSAVNKP
jgi:hypothetical protein